MLFNLHRTFISACIVFPLVAGSLNLEVDGRMNFGTKWNYEYRIKPIETSSFRSFTAMNQDNIEEDEEDGPKMIDIIIKNNKSNPRLVQVAEARIYDKNRNMLRVANETTPADDRTEPEKNDNEKNDDDTSNIEETNDAERTNKKQKLVPNTLLKDEPVTFAEEMSITDATSTKPEDKDDTKETQDITTVEKVKHDVRIESEELNGKPLVVSEERSNLGAVNGATVMWPGEIKHKRKRKHKSRKSTPKAEEVRNIESTINNSVVIVKKGKIKKNGTKSVVKLIDQNITKNTSNLMENRIAVEDFPKVTEMNEYTKVPDIYIKPHYVRDDPKIKEFTKHVYEQSIKTFEAIKAKLNNYEIKKEADYLMRGYEEKFGDFVRETQNQMIKTRLGNEKVILNTVDTSNRILDRLVNYLIGKMDKKGILRNAGAENVILKEINKKKELENKHICNKMGICRSSDSLSQFLIDVLTTILSSDDKKVTEMRDACTEVLKNTDFSRIMDADTERRFHRGISDLETYDVNLIRPIFAMIKNIIASRNTPIKVVGPTDSRVNKTVAFMEIINNFDKKLLPNEKNVLEWNDMRNTFREWKDGKRKDSVELVQHLTDHILSPGSKVKEGNMFDRNINTILGF